jgi:hypothetical protein
METGAKGLTTIVIVFEMAGLPVAQDRFEVNSQVIMSPLDGTRE